jgi:hypothetical protein
MIIEPMREICLLQPSYSPTNTVEMQQRGHLIRRVLPDEIRRIEAELRNALGAYGPEFDVGASDGIGRKTEAPWVRLFAKSMSPTPRDGFYVVIHFAADGSAVFITLGCGSTIWANGELRALSDQELEKRTRWARNIILEGFGSTYPFEDKIALKAKAGLPKTFEKATAVAKRLPVENLNEEEVEQLLIQATERLRELYIAQSEGRNLTNAQVTELELELIARPTRKGSLGQGFHLSAEERKAIELRAMDVSREWLEKDGYTVKDTSKTSSFDYEASSGEVSLKVEVKGTTSDDAESIFMTKNEVELHRKEKGRTALFIVSKIRIDRSNQRLECIGGDLTTLIGWNIDEWDLVPMAYQLKRKSNV